MARIAGVDVPREKRVVIALTYILVNFISDLLYGVADPRIKLE